MIRPISTLIIFLSIAATGRTADFTLREHLGHTWTNERVTFPLTAAQAAKVEKKLALVGADEKQVPYQLVNDVDQNHPQICFQANLPPLKTSEYSFSNQRAVTKTDLKIRETAGGLVIENELIGLAIRKTLQAGQGPIARVRLRSGKWTGDSSLLKTPQVKNYSAEVIARGPVFVEVLCRATFVDEGHWKLRFRIERGEPAVLVDESFDAPGGGAFRVALGDQGYRTTHMLYRSGEGGNMGRVNSHALASGRAYLLQPWLQWWGADRQGNWFSLYTAAPQKQPSIDGPKIGNDSAEELLGNKNQQQRPDPHPDMLMIGLLRPSLWRDPKWSGKAPQVGINVPAQVEESSVTVSFPLGGGRRAWMLGTPEKAQSIHALSSKSRRVAPLPQRYLIKHGDFPLDVVKGYVLDWKGDHENYPRLFVGKDELPNLRKSLKSSPQELKRWESQQPIDKYNIGGPLRAYYASGSKQLGSNIVKRTTEWLHLVVHEDLLLQNSRVTLGVAPHNQAVMLLPTLNLTDSALGVGSLTPDLRKKFLAHLAMLGYVVSSDNYWSPARGFSANPNMTTTVAQYQVTVASLIPSHPMAKQWAAKGLGTLRYQMNAWSDEDGGWLEAPHYAMVSFDHMLGAFIMASRAGFGNHLYEDRMRKVAEWFAKIATPPDSHTGGFRHHPPIGNTYHGEGTGMFGIVAGLWKQRDPEFAAHMEWMNQQHGSPDLGLGWSFPAMTGYKDLLKAHGVAPKKPDYGSAWFRKTGVVLRNKLGTGRETYLHLIAGSNHEHYDIDSGSIVLWGKGRVLVDDWGYIGRHAQKFHSLLSSSATVGNMQISDFSTQPALDCVSGKKGSWQRQIAMVKDADPLGPNFFLIRDTHDADAPADWRLWLSTKPDVEQQRRNAPKFPLSEKNKGSAADLLGDIEAERASKTKSKAALAPPVRVHAQGVTVQGDGDVDFDLFIYQPERLDLKTETVSQNMTMASRDGKVGPLRLTQTALIATLKDRGSVTTLIYPRLKTEPSPKVVWHAQGRIAEVVSDVGTDYVFVTPKQQIDLDGKSSVFKTKSGDISFHGSVGAIQTRGKQTALTLGDEGEIGYGNEKLTGKGQKKLTR